MERVGLVRAVGAVAALAAGCLWIVKSVAILLADRQPPVVFEAALPLFGLAVAMLAVEGRARHQRCGLLAAACGAVGMVSGLIALADEAAGGEPHVAIAVSAVGFVLGLALLAASPTDGTPRDLHVRRSARLLLLAYLASLLLGGVLAMLDERLLELPLLGVALLWCWVGATSLRI